MATRPVIIGHLNGGYISLLFAVEHSVSVGAAISLDNRRMPLSRNSQPQVCSIRSSNFAADLGVLPSQLEQEALGKLIVGVPVAHGDMRNGGAPKQKEAILKVIANRLGRRSRR